jgi:predicted nucleotidyltransferase component of viral defense system
MAISALTADSLATEAARLGVQPKKVERAYHLLRILNELQENPKTAGKFSLKGGTAFNLFHGKLPRISQDIDLNYTGAVSREQSQQERPIVNEGIHEVLQNLGFLNIYSPVEQGREYEWRAEYESLLGGRQSLSLDINFFKRLPVFPQHEMQSLSICGLTATFSVLDQMDLVASKFMALFNRPTIAPRDAYDLYRILTEEVVDIRNPLFRIPLMIEIASHSADLILKSDDPRYSLFLWDVMDKIHHMGYGNLVQEMRTSLSRDALEELMPGGIRFAPGKYNEVKDKLELACMYLLTFSREEIEFLTELKHHGKIRADILLCEPGIPEEMKPELKQRIENNSYLQFICRNIADKKDKITRGELSRREANSPADESDTIVMRAREKGVTEVFTKGDIRLIEKAVKNLQAKDKSWSTEDAIDEFISSIAKLRAEAKAASTLGRRS